MYRASLSGVSGSEKVLKLLHKGVDILEFPVNRGKADICHLVQLLQRVHCVLADGAVVLILIMLITNNEFLRTKAASLRKKKA